MARTRYSDEDVLKLLREIDVHLHDGLDVVSACRKAGISDKGTVRQSSPSISIGLSTLFYEIIKERHSVRAASRLSLKVLRFESDLF